MTDPSIRSSIRSSAAPTESGRGRRRRIGALTAAGLAVVLFVALSGTGVAHAWFGEDIWEETKNTFDGDCDDDQFVPFDAVPCDLDSEGEAEPICEAAVTVTGLKNITPTDAIFKVENVGDDPAYGPAKVTEVSYKFSDGTVSIDPIPGDTFLRNFQPADAGQHSVTVTATTKTGAVCSTTHEFFVRPKPWMVLNAKPVAGQPMQVDVHAAAMIDYKLWNSFNWDLGGGQAVDCGGTAWCLGGDLVVEFPAPGYYDITASPTLLNTGLERTITVKIGEPAPSQQVLVPVPDVTDDGPAPTVDPSIPELPEVPEPTAPTPRPTPDQPSPEVRPEPEAGEGPVTTLPGGQLPVVPTPPIVPVPPRPTPPVILFPWLVL